LKIPTKGIEAIIFDLGGVLLHIDYVRTIRSFEQLGIENAMALFSQKSQTSFFDDMETGLISEDQFRMELNQLSAKKINSAEIDAAWNAMLLDFPNHRLEFLREIGKDVRIFLLSNTNSIHIRWFELYMESRFGPDAFYPLFEKVYLSHQVGMRKPNREIFELVLHQNGLNPDRTIFVDDSIQHVDGAKSAGIKAHLLPPDVDVTSVFIR
jgi:putative hydrolase of the HAD superfamily